MTSPTRCKPDWLKVRFQAGPNVARIERLHREQGLHTVCRSAACPNQGECWSRGVATFMILGNRCTRTCTFCNVEKAPPAPPDPQEPRKIADAVAILALAHAVVTTVTRDDLPDGGASHFAAVTKAIRDKAPGCRIELLISDLKGNLEALRTIIEASPEVLGHNIETVPRLYPQVRAGADYARSLKVLETAAELAPQIPTKSGLMLGLGEDREEILSVLGDLRKAGCAFLTLGQYLAPTQRHHPVMRYVPPEEFDELRRRALEFGFTHVEAGPLVRSSYHAEEQFREGAHG